MVPADFDMAFFAGIRDSKKLSEKKRNEWAEALVRYSTLDKKDVRYRISDKNALVASVVYVSAQDIDTFGMSATLNRAVAQALQESGAEPECTQVLLDGTLRAPEVFVHQKSIIRGDNTEPLISAASIVAKVARDAHMVVLDQKYPQYGFAQHKGYGTKAHREAIQKHGMCPEHRRSFCNNMLH